MSSSQTEPKATEPEQAVESARTKSTGKRATIAVLCSLAALTALISLGWFIQSKSDYAWARRVVENSTIYSMSKSEVDERLGPPDNPEGIYTNWDYVYHLKPDSLGLDNLWLVIRVDETNQVVTARVVSD
ncbi:MAG: hypothetical protein ACX94C_13485 [Phycisphaerales bacterium]